MAGRWLDWGRVVATGPLGWLARSGPVPGRGGRASARRSSHMPPGSVRQWRLLDWTQVGARGSPARGGSRSLIPPFFGCVPGEGHVSGRVFILSFFSDRSTEEHSIFWLVDGWQF